MLVHTGRAKALHVPLAAPMELRTGECMGSANLKCEDCGLNWGQGKVGNGRTSGARE